CYGVDISPEVISELKIAHPTWFVNVCDFTDSFARKKCRITKNRLYDLVILNPPFTCKGSTINKVTFNGEEYRTSTAMMFVVEALQYMHKNSILLAILPISCAYSQKDRKIWQALEEHYNLTILEERDKQNFKKCNPNIVLVSINDFSIVSNRKSNNIKLNINEFNLSTFRGNLSVHKSKNSSSKNKKRFVHSTNLIDNSLQNLKKYTHYPKSEISGPAVLISRVGNPSIKKICTISKNETYVISDCIIAIKTENQNDAETLKHLFIENWEYVKTLYKGTAAKYITMERLHSFLGF
ncbi:MAG: hypothetical protein LBR75_01985, partial [Prevotellaceae bacterium]|nr:hypothetical protein [Prevotellaceae bacterium]